MDQIASESRQGVWKMFDQISGRYDFLNHLLSCGIDIYWRRQLLPHLPPGQALRLLDLATGTADQLLTIVRSSDRIDSALGLDLSGEMIRRGQRKLLGKPYAHRVTLTQGDATQIALRDQAVDCLTLAFGIRNITPVTTCLQECFRVLAPGGRLLILEFSLPPHRLIRTLYLLYLRHLLPYIAGLFSHHQGAYRYLGRTIEEFPHGKHFCTLLGSAGFCHVTAYPLTFGVATLYVGDKPPCPAPQ